MVGVPVEIWRGIYTRYYTHHGTGVVCTPGIPLSHTRRLGIVRASLPSFTRGERDSTRLVTVLHTGREDRTRLVTVFHTKEKEARTRLVTVSHPKEKGRLYVPHASHPKEKGRLYALHASHPP